MLAKYCGKDGPDGTTFPARYYEVNWLQLKFDVPLFFYPLFGYVVHVLHKRVEILVYE